MRSGACIRLQIILRISQVCPAEVYGLGTPFDPEPVSDTGELSWTVDPALS
jgi:hypothetical protein